MKKILLGFISFYQRYISPCTPPACRFTPTCSEYAKQAIAIHGACKGTRLAMKRLCRCHPFYKGDLYDPVPEWIGTTKEDKK